MSMCFLIQRLSFMIYRCFDFYYVKMWNRCFEGYAIYDVFLINIYYNFIEFCITVHKSILFTYPLFS